MNKVTKKPRELTRKQRNFVDMLLNEPTLSATEVAMRVYQGNRKTAEVIASENLRKPEIRSYLFKANTLVESALVTTVRDWSDSDKPRQREIALDSAKFIHDKIHGKASQSVSLTSTSLNITLDLTGGNSGPIPQSVIDALAD